MHQSVATIDSPEFLNLQPLDINPLMSKCEIKVLYVGANRNHTFITEEVAAEIGKTLRGAPIVGYYRDTKEDFTGHGEKVIIDDEGIKFECQTVPYGFVAPDAHVWFQTFEDSDEFGNTIIRKYLMTTGYLWTGQFPECTLPIDEGRPQSMELEPNSVQGRWETNLDNGMDFFIINDAIIQKICILGDDVEPCFEGASVTAPSVSAQFTLDDKFRHTLYTMMQDLRSALNEGGQQMQNFEKIETEENVNTEYSVEENDQTPSAEDSSSVEYSENQNENEETSDYAKNEEEEKEDEETSEDENADAEDTDEEKEEKTDDDDEQEKTAKKYADLQTAFDRLNEQYEALNNHYQELLAFKTTIDNEKKDALIAEFYMLSNEEKADVISNKEKYTLDEIKAKLSVICFDKKINFALEENKQENKNDNIITYTIGNDDNSLPDWVKAVKEQENID